MIYFYNIFINKKFVDVFVSQILLTNFEVKEILNNKNLEVKFAYFIKEL